MYAGEEQKQKRQRLFVLRLLATQAAVIAGLELSLDLYLHFFPTFFFLNSVSSSICHRTVEPPFPGFHTSIYRINIG